MRLAAFLGRRLLGGLFVLWGTASLIFIALTLTPGDPALIVLGGPEALPTPAVLAQVRADYGFNLPWYQQYLHFFGQLLRGDLGVSYRLHAPVASLIGAQLGASAGLAAAAMALGAGLALLLALSTAGRWPRLTAALDALEVIASSVPVFITGLALLLAFSFSLHLLPSSSTQGWTSELLPLVTLALPIAGILGQVLRRELEEVLEQPFIVTARTRGLSEAGVRLRHALRHALVQALTMSGLLFSGLIASAVVVETVFNRQGLGRLMADAAANRDVPLVIGIALLAAAVIVVVNGLVEGLTAWIDPRTVHS